MIVNVIMLKTRMQRNIIKVTTRNVVSYLIGITRRIDVHQPTKMTKRK